MKQHEQRGRDGTGQALQSASRVPGKQTLVEQAYGEAHAIQRKASRAPVATADDARQRVAGSNGAPVDVGIRSRVEAATGAQLGDARVHTGDPSGAAASALGARAFATGNDIHFGAGEYQPGSTEGQRLITHELVHTVQQRGGGAVQHEDQVSEPGDAAEVEADQVADAVVRGDAAGAITQTSAPIARQTGGASFSQTLGTKKTTLTGTSGTYEVTHGLTKKPDTSKSPPFGEYSVQITMKPNASTGGHAIAFIQTWRMREPSGTPVTTAEKGADVSATEVNRMDPKSGMVLDRANPTRDKTPYFGMFKDGGALKERSTTHQGKHGGDDVRLEDTPGVNDPDHMEFTATATDMTDGTPLDAIGWGFKYDSSKSTYTEETPAVVRPGSERMAGRDRAYKKWNDKVATSGSGIDAVRMPFDPAAIAEGVAKAMSGFGTDEAKIQSLLLGVTDADRRLRVAACFKLETGQELKDALREEMSGDELKGLEDWLK